MCVSFSLVDCHVLLMLLFVRCSNTVGHQRSGLPLPNFDRRNTKKELIELTNSRWWQLIFLFPSLPGEMKWSNLTSIFFRWVGQCWNFLSQSSLKLEFNQAHEPIRILGKVTKGFEQRTTERWKNNWLFRVYKGLYYSVMWGLFHKPWNKDPHSTTRM